MTMLATFGLLASAAFAQVDQKLKPLPGDVTAVAFSPDSKWLAAASKQVTLVDTQKWEIKLLGSHGHYVEGIAFSPDGKVLATGGWDRDIKLWQVDNGQELATLKGHPDGISVLAYSADGRFLASGDWSGTVKVWEIKTGQEVGSIKGHRRGVGAISWDKDGKTLEAASWDGSVRKYSLGKIFKAEGEVRLPLPGCHFVTFSPDGKRVLTGAGQNEMYELKTFDASSGTELQTFKTHLVSLRRAAYFSDGTRVASIAINTKMLKLWNAETGAVVKELDAAVDFLRVHSLAVSAKGEWVAVGADSGNLYVFRIK